MTGLAYYTFAIKTGGSSYLVRYVVCIYIIQFSGGCLYSLIEKKDIYYKILSISLVAENQKRSCRQDNIGQTISHNIFLDRYTL